MAASPVVAPKKDQKKRGSVLLEHPLTSEAKSSQAPAPATLSSSNSSANIAPLSPHLSPRKESMSRTDSPALARPSPSPSPLSAVDDASSESSSSTQTSAGPVSAVAHVPYREQFRRTVESGDVLEIHAVLSLYPNFVKARSLLSMLYKMYKKASPATRDVIHSVLKFWCEARFAVDFTVRAGKGNKVFNRLLRLLSSITKLNPTWNSSSPSPVVQIKLTLLRNHSSHYATTHVLPKYSKIAESLASMVKINKDEYSQYMSLVAWG
jgi:hypothetical protein